MYAKKEEIYPPYILKHNSNCQKQVILLMISNGEGLQHLAIKKLSPLLKQIMSNHRDYFYPLNYIYSFETEKTCESH